MRRIVHIVYNDLGGNIMTNEFVAKSVDMLWDSWLTNFKTLQQVQAEAEKKTLEAFNVQQQLVEKSVAAFSAVEEQSKQFTEQLQQTVKASTAQLPQQEPLVKWFEAVEQITTQAQQFTWKPNELLVSTLTETQKQWEETVKTAFSQQQEKRTEVLTKIEELAEQLKESQKQLLSQVGLK